VSIGYILMLIVALFNQTKFSKWIFIIGWTLMILLAVIDSLMAFFQGNICPKNEADTPLCYISLSLLYLWPFYAE